jgi:hypothetical protein
MPVKSNIEFSSGPLYFKGLDEPIPVSEGQATYEAEYADDLKYIKLSQEPIEFTLENAEFTKGWTLTECRECGYEFPITNLYNLLYGSSGWLCPRCTFIKRLEEMRERDNK